MSEPTTIKMWRPKRVEVPKIPQTLADCKEGRLVICRQADGAQVIRMRLGRRSCNSEGRDAYNDAEDMPYVRYLDDPQPTAPPVPKTFGELRDGQCFRCWGTDTVRWKYKDYDYAQVTGTTIGTGCCVEWSTPVTFIPDIEMVLEELP